MLPELKKDISQWQMEQFIRKNNNYKMCTHLGKELQNKWGKKLAKGEMNSFITIVGDFNTSAIGRATG